MCGRSGERACGLLGGGVERRIIWRIDVEEATLRAHLVGSIAILGSLALACVTASRSVRAVDFTRGVWQIRIDVDSAPTRLATATPNFGSIDFARHSYSLDFWRAINHRLPNAAYVTALEEPTRYRITLGDSASFDEKIVLVGRAVTPDSVVGTWMETIVCCSAGGRFTLWRSPDRRPPSGVP